MEETDTLSRRAPEPGEPAQPEPEAAAEEQDPAEHGSGDTPVAETGEPEPPAQEEPGSGEELPSGDPAPDPDEPAPPPAGEPVPFEEPPARDSGAALDESAQSPAADSAPDAGEPAEPTAEEPVSAEELLGVVESAEPELPPEDGRLKAVLEALVYVTDEPLSVRQIAAVLELPVERIQPLLDQLVAEYDQPWHGLTIREVAGGYKMATKAEHHEAVRNFAKSLKPPLKLSLAALETLAVIAYKQPVTAPEVGEIRGVQGTGVLKTLLDRKLIAAAGRKNVIGKPILYRTTKDFLVQFGLKDLSELPTLKEFEEIGRMALADAELPPETALPEGAAAPEAAPADESAPGREPEAAPPPSEEQS